MGPIVSTHCGRIEGAAQRGVQVFRGIPYARPPTGARRFRPPEPAEPWSGVRAAQRFGPSAPQSAPMQMLVRRTVGVSGAVQSEDCLYLNVWTPRADDGRRPVLVWIHGGGFVMGSGSTFLYTGRRMALRGDVVVVTFNYRLGALGFLNLHGHYAGGDAPSNAGLRDQIAALEWVRDNIEAFGGDPENVTVFGESAGGMSVGSLLGAPDARGLFRRAIAQSGAADNVSTREQAHAVAERFLAEIDVAARDLDSLRKLPLEEVVRAQRATTIALGIELGILAWQPAIDTATLPEQPLRAIARGFARGVSLLAGTNRDEWKLFLLGDGKGRRLDEAGLGRRVRRALGGADGGARAERALEIYRRVDAGSRSALPSERWSAFQSDRIFHVPALRLADAQSPHAPATFLYRFDWTPPLLGNAVGACHGLELPFVFGTLHDAVLRPTLGITGAARRLSNRMQDAWIAFARGDSPAHEDLPIWPRYEVADRHTMVLDGRCRVRGSNTREEARRFWEEGGRL